MASTSPPFSRPSSAAAAPAPPKPTTTRSASSSQDISLAEATRSAASISVVSSSPVSFIASSPLRGLCRLAHRGPCFLRLIDRSGPILMFERAPTGDGARDVAVLDRAIAANFVGNGGDRHGRIETGGCEIAQQPLDRTAIVLD